MKSFALTKNDKKIFYALLFPVLIETVLVRIFHIADSMMLGQMSDSTLSVAAVGLCVSPTNLIISVTSAFFIGTTAAIAWYYGADEKKNMRTLAWQMMVVSLFVAALFAFISYFFADAIMGFICQPGEMLEIATTYYRINAIGFFFQILTANITASLRGIGISKIAMLYNLTGGIVNVGLNYLLIFGKLGFPELRVAGAAWATVISKIVSFVFALLFLVLSKTELNFKLGINKKIDGSIKNKVIPIGLTAAFEQIILQFGAIISTKILAALSTAEIAANNIVVNIEGFAWSTGSACQVASTSLFGRSLGEHNEKKARSYLELTVKWAIGFAVVEILTFVFLGKFIAIGFTNDKSLLPMIYVLLLISAIELPFINTHQSVSGALRSAGDSLAPLIASFISLWIFRVLLGYITVSVLDMGIVAYRLTISVDQFVRCLIMVILFLTNHWKK